MLLLNLRRLPVVLLLCMQLTGCMQSPQQLLLQADALQRQQHQQLSHQYPHQRLPKPVDTVVVSEQFYVPKLDERLAAKPAWYSRQVTADMRGLPLQGTGQRLAAWRHAAQIRRLLKGNILYLKHFTKIGVLFAICLL